jgi:hypothetical protein
VNRIFPALTVTALALLTVALLLGLMIGDLRGPLEDPATQQALRIKTVHFFSGLVAALAVVMVDSILVTYFVGTGRWCREVSEAYRLSPDFVRRSTHIKRRAFPLALASMLVAVGMAALGAAADPAANVQVRLPGGATWAQAHLLGVLLGTSGIAAAFFWKVACVQQHRQVVNDVLQEVHRIRRERGLETGESSGQPVGGDSVADPRRG